jgi:alkaline phosphatase D
MSGEALVVRWELAEDSQMRKVIRTGTNIAAPELGYSIHAEPRGLKPHRDYWYRFRVGDHVSQIGRTRTLPAAQSSPSALTIAVACCQNYQTGYYTAYEDLATSNPDIVLFLGEYIYEYPPRGTRDVRPLLGTEPADLASYRQWYTQHRMDPDLQAAHAAAPFVTIWDDHEVKNDYAGLIPQPSNSLAIVKGFAARRAAAYQAYYEHLPMRRPSSTNDFSTLRIYQRLVFGDLATMNMLDTRQYRSDQPCDPGTAMGNLEIDSACKERNDPARTILGEEQRNWLLSGLSESHSRWNLIAQQLLFADLLMTDEDIPGRLVWEADGWDGYGADRARIMNQIQPSKLSNPVVLSGDIHAHGVFDLRSDFENAKSRVIATEFARSRMMPNSGTGRGPRLHAAVTSQLRSPSQTPSQFQSDSAGP